MQTSHPALVVSIHDVSPLTREAVVVMLDDLRAAGVGKTSLLVIPDHHHKAAMAADAGFCAWLREKQSDGHEIVLHGYYHRRARQAGGWWTRLVTEHYTAGEGEFFDLTENQAAARLGKARKEFAAEGFFPTGFIAPAWLLGESAERAVRKAGFAYTTRIGNVLDLAGERVTASQSLVWSVRAGWRRRVSLWWNAYLFRRLRGVPLLRVGLHPPDWNHPAIKRQILDLIGAALATRDVITYDEWQARPGDA